jgi:uncharacterized membrane protein
MRLAGTNLSYELTAGLLLTTTGAVHGYRCYFGSLKAGNIDRALFGLPLGAGIAILVKAIGSLLPGVLATVSVIPP